MHDKLTNMSKRSVFILLFFYCTIITCNRAQNLTSLLSNINITDVFKGIKISNELKRQLINCISTDVDGKPAYERCPDDKIPIPDLLKMLFPEISVTTEPPKGSLLGILGKVKDAVIVRPITSITDKLKKVITEGAARAKKLKGTLTGAREEAEVLITFASRIKANKSVRDPNDPYRDISYVLINKNKHNINSDPLAVVQNRKALIGTFANTDMGTIRRYGANYNPLVPNVILYGLLKTIAAA